MKPGITPVLNSAWWKTNKGTTVSAAPLEGALKKYETAKRARAELIAEILREYERHGDDAVPEP